MVEPIANIPDWYQLCGSCALFTQSWVFATGRVPPPLPKPHPCCPLLAHLESIPSSRCGLRVVLTPCHCSFLYASELYGHSQALNPTFARSYHYLALTSPVIAMSRPPPPLSVGTQAIYWNAGTAANTYRICTAWRSASECAWLTNKMPKTVQSPHLCALLQILWSW